VREGGDAGSEIEADVTGARYAVRAGCDPAAYLAWVMQTQGPGARMRVDAIGNTLGVTPEAVWAKFR